MTLELRLTDVTGKNYPQYIYVDGGQSGMLRLNAKSLPQLIKCSRNDHLVFYVCGKDSQLEPKNIIARQDFWANATIDQNRDTWNADKEVQYHLDYFDTMHQKIGTLVFQVKYNRGLFYFGQISGIDKVAPKLLPFYKVRCPTYNLYNCLDSQPQTSRFNLIQSIYRD